MTVPIHEAAEVLTPLLSTGADVASRELASQAGSGFAKAALSVIDKLRGKAREPNPGVHEIEDALEAGLAAGAVTEAELRSLVTENLTAGKNVYSRNTFNIGGDFHG